MKFRLTLPPKPNWQHYFKTELKRSEKWMVYGDPSTGNLIRLYVPINATNTEGEITLLISPQFQKGESQDYLYAFNFKLFLFNEETLPRVNMIRENYKSVFPYTLQPSLFNCSVPHPHKSKIWVSYSFVEIE